MATNRRLSNINFTRRPLLFYRIATVNFGEIAIMVFFCYRWGGSGLAFNQKGVGNGVSVEFVGLLQYRYKGVTCVLFLVSSDLHNWGTLVCLSGLTLAGWSTYFRSLKLHDGHFFVFFFFFFFLLFFSFLWLAGFFFSGV